MFKRIILLLFCGVILNLYALENHVKIDHKGICIVDQIEYPIVGFGTYPLVGEKCTVAIEEAVKMGFRIIDTATFYQNFQAIAKAIQNYDRKQFYIISKVWHDKQSPEELMKDPKSNIAGASNRLSRRLFFTLAK